VIERNYASIYKKNGVQTLIHYPTSPHKQPAYSEYKAHSMPTTELAIEQVLSLPMDPSVEEPGIDKVIEVINGYKL
jgi:dTDP-4-amino-4,6-dideoxygalactose transaminase